MGDYVATHLRFTLKPETPSDIVAFLAAVFSPAAVSSFDDFGKIVDDTLLTPSVKALFVQTYRNQRRSTNDGDGVISDFDFMLHGISAYHDCMHGSTMNGLTFESYASCNYLRFDLMILVNFFGALLPWLTAEHGDIVARTVFEDHRNETVVFIGTAGEVIGTGYGWRYDDALSNHPWHSEEDDTPFVPDMNRDRLIAAGRVKDSEAEYFLFEHGEHN